MKKKAIIVSGYFNPIHKGHIAYFNNAKALCDVLFVIVNSDLQRALKGAKEFQMVQRETSGRRGRVPRWQTYLSPGGGTVGQPGLRHWTSELCNERFLHKPSARANRTMG